MQGRWRQRWLVAGIMFMAAAAASAQPFTIPRFDFSFSNPGARALGFAGAFAALADDATAAFGNPAGLVQLTKTEVSAELRLWDRSSTFLAGGRAEGSPTGDGLDVLPGFDFARDERSTLGLSYAAVVVPKGRWSFAFYANQLARFVQEAESQGFFFDGDLPGEVGRFPGSRERVDLEVRTVGAAAAWRVDERLSVGVGLVYGQATMRTTAAFYLPDSDAAADQLGAISFQPDRLLTTTSLDVDGRDWTFNAGLLWRATPQVSVGVYHRQGASVDGIIAQETGPVVPSSFRAESVALFDVPDVTGLGVAYRARGGRLTVATEIDRVGYGGILRVRDDEALGLDARTYDNAWEVHLGAEYALIARTPLLAFRAGAWVEANEGDLADDNFVHWTAGFGVVTRMVQIDVGVDLSDEVDTASLSFIYTF